MIKVLIADDQECVREGLAALLPYHKNIEIVGQAADGNEACRLALELKPDVVLMDIRMPGCDGIEATATILKHSPSARVLVLTTFDEDELIVKALKAGASGYLLKDTKSERIAAGIQTVFEGGLLLGPSSGAKLISRLDAAPARDPQMRQDLEAKLSERKLEVLKLIGQGKSNTEIAEILHITEGTTKNYVSQIFEQLGVRDRVQLALIAQQELL